MSGRLPHSRVPFFAISLLLVLAVSAAAGNMPTRRLKHASGPIVALAMDGPRVVYSTDRARTATAC